MVYDPSYAITQPATMLVTLDVGGRVTVPVGYGADLVLFFDK